MHATRSHYHAGRIVLHWLTLALLVAVFATIEGRVLFVKGTPPRELVKSLHFMLGVVVLVPVLLRIAASFAWPAPPVEPPMPALQQALARAMHLTLYAWLIAMPLTGWIVHNAEGHALVAFGLELPRLVEADKAFGKSLEAWHEWCGTCGYFLIGAHALAALFHHHVTRDNTLTRMLPWVQRPQPCAEVMPATTLLGSDRG